MMDKKSFLDFVHLYIKENPTWVGDTVAACNAGLEDYLQELLFAKSQVESALVFALAPPYEKDRRAFIKEKLLSCKKHWNIKWDWYIEGKKFGNKPRRKKPIAAG
jgi:hypothetical protein